MRKVLSAALVTVTLLLILAAPSDAGGRRGHWHGHRHGGVRLFVGLGPAFWYGPYPYWRYPYPYYYGYSPDVYTPPTVVVQEPPVYVQQQPAPAVPPATGQAAPPEGYWYYCASARGYYPSVPTCSEAWIKVPPRQE
jgi:hypothetical protein